MSRTIPVPKSVSAEAQAVLATGGAMVADRLANPQVSPALDDNAGWKARIAETDAVIALGFGGRTSEVDVACDKIDVAGIDVYVLEPEGADTGDDAADLLRHPRGRAHRRRRRRLPAHGHPRRRARRVCSPGRSTTACLPTSRIPRPSTTASPVYRALLEIRRPEQIAVGGGSAGGNLAAALMLKARAEGLPMPACLLLMTPEVDLTESGDTFDILEGVDTVLVSRLTDSIALYVNGHDLRDSFLSPLFGDVSEFPPTLLQSGTRDLFLSNTVRLHRVLRAANVEADEHLAQAVLGSQLR